MRRPPRACRSTQAAGSRTAFGIRMLLDVLLIVGLVSVSGLFAMSEIAVVSSRRSRLQQMADDGSSGARHAVKLASHPTRFLSSIQVGITTIAILTGAIGEAAVTSPLREWLGQVPAVAAHARILATAITVTSLSFVSLIIGELVPKRVALARPERIASLVARPMDVVETVARPIVYVLTATTDAVVRALGIREGKQPDVTVDELRSMLKQGAREGVLERAEQQMATNVFDLEQRYVEAVMTSRSHVVFLDTRDSLDQNMQKLRQHPHDALPLCDGGLDQVLGIIRSRTVLQKVIGDGELDLRSIAEPPLFVPERMTLMRLLEEFRRTGLPTALVVDEFGEVEGLISVTDVVAAVVGELPAELGDEPMVVERGDGTWLVDGGLDLGSLARRLETGSLATPEEREHYHTAGGLAMAALGQVPRTGDTFERNGYRFEIVDMDGNRVDRLLVSRSPDAQG